jgi:hypothetical protein
MEGRMKIIINHKAIISGQQHNQRVQTAKSNKKSAQIAADNLSSISCLLEVLNRTCSAISNRYLNI